MTAPEGGTGATGGGDTGASGGSGSTAPAGGTGSSGGTGDLVTQATNLLGKTDLNYRTVEGGSPFQDSAVYDQFWLTHQVRQFDRAPLTAESILTAVAGPSCAALYAEYVSNVTAWETAPQQPLTTRAEMTNNHDAYLNFFDSTSINRDYGSTG